MLSKIAHAIVGLLFPDSSKSVPSKTEKDPKLSFLDIESIIRTVSWKDRLTASEKSGLQFLLQKISQDDEWVSFDHIAYFLASIRHETGIYGLRYQPILEHISDRDAERNYGYTSKIGPERLGNIYPGDGCTFKGAGYVQVTGRANAKKIERKFGVNLTNPPALFRQKLLDPDFGYAVCATFMRQGLFTGKSLHDYDTRNGFDAYNARRIVNGLVASQALACQQYYAEWKKVLTANHVTHA